MEIIAMNGRSSERPFVYQRQMMRLFEMKYDKYDEDSAAHRWHRSLQQWINERLYLTTGLSGDEKRWYLWKWKYICPPGFVVHRKHNCVSFTQGFWSRLHSTNAYNRWCWVREFWLRTYLPYIMLLSADEIDQNLSIRELLDWLNENTRSRWHGREVRMGIEICFENGRDAVAFYMQYSDYVRASVVAR